MAREAATAQRHLEARDFQDKNLDPFHHNKYKKSGQKVSEESSDDEKEKRRLKRGVDGSYKPMSHNVGDDVMKLKESFAGHLQLPEPEDDPKRYIHSKFIAFLVTAEVTVVFVPLGIYAYCLSRPRPRDRTD